MKADTIWAKKNLEGLFNKPFNELIFQAQRIHRQHFNSNEVELCLLHSIKTGRCPEDCSYCPQSGHYNTEVQPEALDQIENIIVQAKAAKAQGATRFCMGAAWRSPPKKALPKVIEMIKAVKQIGLESCATLGMLDKEDAKALKAAGLDFYNHNLDTSESHYRKIISTRSYKDRLNTLSVVNEAGINVCCGGILGMGETRQDRIDFVYQLSQLSPPPKSIPINQLIPIPGTPLENSKRIDAIEFIRTIAVTRIVMPASVIRLSAGRENMSEEMQALCYLSGANSIFIGDKLLTALNPNTNKDAQLFKKLGINSTLNTQTTC